MKALTQRDWLTVGDAASLLGVSQKTLRNWDKAGKLRPIRHPINGYRLYRAADLHSLRRELTSTINFQHMLDLDEPSSQPQSEMTSKAFTRADRDEAAMHWRAEVALDPKHRPQLWAKPSSTVRRDWRKYPQEAHVLDPECRRYRRLTPQEIAVIQGFEPELTRNTEFSNRQIIAALGNAVPPAMSRVVMQCVADRRSWQNKTALEVCAGIGGITRGVAAAGFEHLLCLDIDPVCIAFLGRMPELRSAQISDTDLRYAQLKKFKGQVGLLTGGPPCQPWSSAGLRLGSQDDRDVLGQMPNLIADVEPEAFVFENVAGLTAGQNKKYFDGLMRQLRAPGNGLKYGVLAATLNAADFGVPQIRERVFIIGFRDEPAARVHECFDAVWSLRTHRDPGVSDGKRQEWNAVGSAIEPLGDPGGWKSWFGSQIIPEERDWE